MKEHLLYDARASIRGMKSSSAEKDDCKNGDDTPPSVNIVYLCRAMSIRTSSFSSYNIYP